MGLTCPSRACPAPITRHEIHLPNVNDVTTAGDADTELAEGPETPPPEKKAPARGERTGYDAREACRRKAGVENDDDGAESGDEAAFEADDGPAEARRRRDGTGQARIEADDGAAKAGSRGLDAARRQAAVEADDGAAETRCGVGQASVEADDGAARRGSR